MAVPWIQGLAIEALHFAAESLLVKFFEDDNLSAHQAKRITVYKSYLQLFRPIRGEIE